MISPARIDVSSVSSASTQQSSRPLSLKEQVAGAPGARLSSAMHDGSVHRIRALQQLVDTAYTVQHDPHHDAAVSCGLSAIC